MSEIMMEAPNIVNEKKKGFVEREFLRSFYLLCSGGCVMWWWWNYYCELSPLNFLDFHGFSDIIVFPLEHSTLPSSHRGKLENDENYVISPLDDVDKMKRSRIHHRTIDVVSANKNFNFTRAIKTTVVSRCSGWCCFSHYSRMKSIKISLIIFSFSFSSVRFEFSRAANIAI